MHECGSKWREKLYVKRFHITCNTLHCYWVWNIFSILLIYQVSRTQTSCEWVSEWEWEREKGTTKLHTRSIDSIRVVFSRSLTSSSIYCFFPALNILYNFFIFYSPGERYLYDIEVCVFFLLFFLFFNCIECLSTWVAVLSYQHKFKFYVKICLLLLVWPEE
jgi:hypothetical protein